MRTNHSRFAFLPGRFTKTYSRTALTGHWRRRSPKRIHAAVPTKAKQQGDLQIRPDASFHIAGAAATPNATLAGWHAGEEYNGTWELHNSNQLTLWLAPKEDGLFLAYHIIRLRRKELVLRPLFNRKNKQHDITYFRL